MGIASAVVSSPAFAYDDPTPPANPVLSALAGGNFFIGTTLTVSLNPGTASCPSSAVAGPTVVNVRQASSASGAGVTVSPATQGPVLGAGPLIVAFFRPAFEFGTGTASISYFARYRCTYGTGQAEICRSWTIQYTSNFFGWSTTASISAPGTTCP